MNDANDHASRDIAPPIDDEGSDSFIKIEKSILYPVDELDRWDRASLVV